MDGQDYAFREKVASQYKMRAVLRNQLKNWLCMAIVPWALFVLHLLEVPLFDKLQINLDQTEKMCQQVYAFSILTVLLGWFSMKKNSVLQLTLAVVINAATSMLPILFLAYKAAFSYILSQQNFTLLVVSLVTFCIHSMVLVKSSQLRSSWQVVKKQWLCQFLLCALLGDSMEEWEETVSHLTGNKLFSMSTLGYIYYYENIFEFWWNLDLDV